MNEGLTLNVSLCIGLFCVIKKCTFLVHHNAISNNIQVAIYVYHCQNSKVWRKQEFQRNINEVHNATL